MNNKGYPELGEAQKIWQEGYNYRCATTVFETREEYIFHTEGVAKAARIIAAAAGINPEKAYILGLLHDYGKKYDERAENRFHGRSGFEELNALGFPVAARICLTHTFPQQNFNNDDYLSYPIDWLNWAHEKLSEVVYDDYDRLIQLCDMFFEGMQMVDFKSRFEGIVRRYNLPKRLLDVLMNNAAFLRSYFEEKTGKNIYQLLNIRAV